MPKYLVTGSYTAEGARGVLAEGGSGRRAATAQLIASLGGTMEAYYFAFGSDDFYIIADMPGNAAVAIGGADRVRVRRRPHPDDRAHHTRGARRRREALASLPRTRGLTGHRPHRPGVHPAPGPGPRSPGRTAGGLTATTAEASPWVDDAVPSASRRDLRPDRRGSLVARRVAMSATSVADSTGMKSQRPSGNWRAASKTARTCGPRGSVGTSSTWACPRMTRVLKPPSPGDRVTNGRPARAHLQRPPVLRPPR